MKKLFVLTAIFALVLAACNDGSTPNGNNNNNKKTTLTINNLSDYALSFFEYGAVDFGDIDSGDDITKEVSEGTKYIYFIFETDSGEQRYRTAPVTCEYGKRNEFTIVNNTVVTRITNTGTDGNTGTLKNFADNDRYVLLTIRNGTSIQIDNVKWNNIEFKVNPAKTWIEPDNLGYGEYMPKGSDFITFNIRATPDVKLRTANEVIVNQDMEFNLTDSLDVVELSNSNKSGKLGDFIERIVWFDNGEGHSLLPYYAKEHIVMSYYYVNPPFSDPFEMIQGTHDYNPPRTNNAIAIGYNNGAKLHLRVTLTKKAKLSFWHANRSPIGGEVPDGAIFTINGTEKIKWTTSSNWSFAEFELLSGINDLIWEKRDGFLSPYAHYYLSLSEILVYYTE